MARSEARKIPGFGALTIVLSAGVHLVTFVALGAVRVDAPQKRNQEVEFEMLEQAPPPPEPEPVAEPEKAPEPEPEPEPVKVVRAPKPVAAPKPVEQAPKTAEPPAAAEETLADFSGTTLTSEGAGGWASAVGNNGAMNGPIGKAGAAVTGRNREGVQGGVVGGTGLRVVGEGDLSRRPRPPGDDVLNAALTRNYPKSAKQQGVEGIARIKVRVMPNGKVEPLATISESVPGFDFAKACKAAVQEARWEPPLDRNGQPVAHDIPYTCQFEID